MEALYADTVFGSAAEHPVEEYVMLCRGVTMIEARAADLLGEIERHGLHEDAGYFTAAAMIRDRLGVWAGEARRRVA